MALNAAEDVDTISRRRRFSQPLISFLAAAGNPVVSTQFLTFAFICAVIGTLTPVWTTVSSAACEALTVGHISELQTGEYASKSLTGTICPQLLANEATMLALRRICMNHS